MFTSTTRFTGLLCLALVLLLALPSQAQRRKPTKKRAPKSRSTTLARQRQFEGAGHTVRLMPAFYRNTLGLELETPIADNLTIGLNLLGKLGKTDVDNNTLELKDKGAFDYGYLAELALKYYFSEAPSGFYLQGTVGYGKLYYGEGAYRPYSLTNAGRNFDGAALPSLAYLPSGLRFGAGVGYQFIIIPRSLVANIMVGAQGVSTDDGIKPSVFLNPSVGFIF